MDGNVKVDHEEMEEAVGRMGTALGAFTLLSQDAFKEERRLLGEMNADFVDRLDRVLEIVKDWNIDRIVENIGAYVGEAEAISSRIREADEALSGKQKE